MDDDWTPGLHAFTRSSFHLHVTHRTDRDIQVNATATTVDPHLEQIKPTQPYLPSTCRFGTWCAICIMQCYDR